MALNLLNIAVFLYLKTVPINSNTMYSNNKHNIFEYLTYLFLIFMDMINLLIC